MEGGGGMRDISKGYKSGVYTRDRRRRGVACWVHAREFSHVRESARFLLETARGGVRSSSPVVSLLEGSLSFSSVRDFERVASSLGAASYIHFFLHLTDNF